MYYNLVRTPLLMKTGTHLLCKIDELLDKAHIVCKEKILITQKSLYDIYKEHLERNQFVKKIFVKGGCTDESEEIIRECKDVDGLVIAFGRDSVIDLVKYCTSSIGKPFISIPSTLSTDTIYSSVARLTSKGKKANYRVEPPIGIIVDLEIIRESPRILILAGVADLLSNLSAIDDWRVAHHDIREPINELAFLLAKEATMPLFRYNKNQILDDDFLYDLTNGLITSGLSMIVSGNTRGTCGSEHLISHAIDEYFPERATIHGIQVGWAHMVIDECLRKKYYMRNFFEGIGLLDVISENVQFRERELFKIVPYGLKIMDRYTILNTIH